MPYKDPKLNHVIYRKNTLIMNTLCAFELRDKYKSAIMCVGVSFKNKKRKQPSQPDAPTKILKLHQNLVGVFFCS